MEAADECRPSRPRGIPAGIRSASRGPRARFSVLLVAAALVSAWATPASALSVHVTIYGAGQVGSCVADSAATPTQVTTCESNARVSCSRFAETCRASISAAPPPSGGWAWRAWDSRGCVGTRQQCALPNVCAGRLSATCTWGTGESDVGDFQVVARMQRTPTTQIDDGPADGLITNQTSATFRFGGVEAERFQCSLDGAPFAPCPSPHTVTQLSVNRHVFRVRGVDHAGNVDATPARRVWYVIGGLPPIPAVYSMRYIPYPHVTRVTRLVLSPGIQGSRVSLTCSGRRCPFSRKALRLARPLARLRLTRYLGDGIFRPRSRLVLRISKPGYVGVLIRWTFHDQDDPTKVVRCLDPDTGKARACS